MMRKLLLMLAWSLYANLGLNAQTNFPQWLNFSAVHILNNITIENSNTIWASTYGAGIVKYETINGYKKVYNGANSMIHRNRIHNIIIDNNQTKWISGIGGLFQCDVSNNWTEIYTLPNGDSLKEVSHIAKNSSGSVAFIYSDISYIVKVGIFDSLGFNAYIVPGAQSVQLMRTLALSNSGDIWVGNNNKISFYNGNSWITYDDNTIPNMGYIYKIITDTNNVMYVAMGSSNGSQSMCYKFDGVNWNLFYNYAGGYSVTFMVIDSNNHLLFGGPFSGIKEYNGNTIITHNSNLPIQNKNVQCFYIDENHDWWLVFTEDPEIIYALKNGVWKTYNIRTSGVGYYSLTGIARDINNRIWMLGSGTKSITMFDGFNFNVFDTTNSPISYPNWSCLNTEPNGNIAFFSINPATGIESVVRYINNNWTFQAIPFLTVTGSAHQMVNDANGNLWIASADGLLKFDGNNWTQYTSMNSGIPGNNVYDIKLDQSNNLWMAIPSKGLVKYDHGSNVWTVYDSINSPLPWIDFIYFFIDNSNKIWIPHNLGITTFDGSGWSNYPSSSIPTGAFPVVQDNNGIVWCGGNKGLSSFDGTNWSEYTYNNSGVTAGVFDVYIDIYGTKWCATIQGGLVLFNENGISSHNFHHLSSSTISGQVFYDINNDGLKDTSDVPLAMQKVLLQPDSIFSISNFNGNYYK